MYINSRFLSPGQLAHREHTGIEMVDLRKELTLSHSHTRTLSHSHTLTLSHSHSLTLTLSLSLSLSHCLTLPHSHTLSLLLSHTLTLSPPAGIRWARGTWT